MSYIGGSDDDEYDNADGLVEEGDGDDLSSLSRKSYNDLGPHIVSTRTASSSPL